jgi:hypothetical protein
MEKKQFQPLMVRHKRLAWSGVKSVAESASSGVTSDGEASLQTSSRHWQPTQSQSGTQK